MPTKHPRIGVARDPELDAALRRAEERLGRKPAATLVRELALRGDEALAADGPPLDPRVRRLVEEFGARPARGSIAGFLDRKPPTPVDPDDPYAAQRALQEMREEKLP